MQLSPIQIDALTELLNIGMGRAAKIVSQMILAPVNIAIPSIKLLARDEFESEVERLGMNKVSVVHMDFDGSLTGNAAMVFSVESAARFASVLMGEDDAKGTDDLDATKIGTVTELGNIVINGIMGTICNVLQERLDYSIPSYSEGLRVGHGPDDTISDDVMILIMNCEFGVESLQVDGEIMIFFKLESFASLLRALDHMYGETT